MSNEHVYSQPEVERRREIDTRFTEISQRLDSGERVMKDQTDATVGLKMDVNALQAAVAVNTVIIKKNAETTEEVRDILVTFKTLGRFAKWVSVIAASAAAAWAALKDIKA